MRYGRLVMAGVLVATAAGAQAPGKGKDKDKEKSAPAAKQQGTAMNTLTAKEKAAGWRLLFDGSTISDWRGYKSQDVPAGWTVSDGAIVKKGSAPDLVTKDQYGNFEFSWDWKIAKGGNAGLFYRGTEEYEHVYWSAPEYQLLDDKYADDRHSRLTSAGADYALYPSPKGYVKPYGQWNHSRIVVNGAHVEHWLNGHKLLSYELWSPDWEAKVKASKFKDWPNYGRAKKGYLAFQGDHNGTLELRDLKIRELP
jgi:hypothetical protein